MSPQLVIDRMENRCRFFGSIDDAPAVSSELNHVAKNRLPDLIGAALKRKMGASFDANSVFRIKKLYLNFTWLKQEFIAGFSATALAENLVTELKQQLDACRLNSDELEIVRYSNHAQFVANLISDLIAGVAWNKWQYQEFSHLKHLDNTEAAIQLLLPRAEQLQEMLITIHQNHQLQPFIKSIKQRQADTLFKYWLGRDFKTQFQSASMPPLDKLRVSLEAVSFTNRQPHLTIEQESLNLLFATLLNDENRLPLDILSCVISHYCLVKRYDKTIIGVINRLSGTHDSEPRVILPGEGSEHNLLTTFVLWLSNHTDNQKYVKQLLNCVENNKTEQPIDDSFSSSEELNEYLSTRPQNKSDIETDVVSSSNIETGVEELSLYSEQAGLVLLLPVIFNLQLIQYYPVDSIRQALHYAAFVESFDEDFNEKLDADWQEDKQPQWFELFFPDNCSELNDSLWLPPKWRHGLNESIQKEIESLNGVPQLCRLITAHFAARLSGLQLSSIGYLQSQFLRTGGYIEAQSEEIKVRLNPVPLYIVLRMAGLADWQEKLPWLSKYLVIEVRE